MALARESIGVGSLWQGAHSECHRVSERQSAHFQVSRLQARQRTDVLEEAEKLVEEMGHNMKMGNIRFLGYLFSKSYKSMYRSIYVCSEGMERVSDSKLHCLMLSRL